MQYSPMQQQFPGPSMYAAPPQSQPYGMYANYGPPSPVQQRGFQGKLVPFVLAAYANQEKVKVTAFRARNIHNPVCPRDQARFKVLEDLGTQQVGSGQASYVSHG